MNAVELRDIRVRFGEVEALRGVSLAVAAGEIHAVVGENGAGKSTLMRVLYGLVPADAGEVWVKGARVDVPTPERALAAGVGMVHQHFMLVDTLSVAENVVLGREPVRHGLLDGARALAEVEALAARHGLGAAAGWARRPAGALSVGERQRVEILKVLYRGADVLVLDEPTAVLTPPEVRELFAVLGRLRAGGATVVLVTHKLDEVMAVSERVTVLRRGEVVAARRTAETTPEALARDMVGRAVGGPPARTGRAPGEVLLAVEDLAAGALDGVTLAVRGGEILGVAGVEGNGQTELAEAVTGLRAARGRVRLAGADVSRASVAARRARGLAHVPEDRHRRGLLLDLAISDNLLLGRERRYAVPGWIDRARLRADAARLLDRFDVRPADPDAPARALSGGNQQKVVLARELATAPRVLVAAQPTRGVDVGAIERIHAELSSLREGGAAVLLISAELDELLALADRIVVLYRGRIVGELTRAEATRERLGAMMTGARPAAIQSS